MIESKNLSYSYTGERSITFPDLLLSPGHSCLILGESGSGKTTGLHLLGGILKSQHGNIFINGTDITTLQESALDHFRGQNVGFIFQKNHLINSLTVKQNVLMAPFLSRKPQDLERIDHVLYTLGIEGKKDAKINSLSEGQAQRVAIARAIINKPAVIFADEPTSALDNTNCDRVIGLLLDVAKLNESTLVIATHDQRLCNVIQNRVSL